VNQVSARNATAVAVVALIAAHTGTGDAWAGHRYDAIADH
jgi:hypothetical protein